MKNILIIGGSSGYGKGVKDYFNYLGYNVLDASRTGKIPLNVVDHEAVEVMFEELRAQGEVIDIVFYSAGIAIGKDYVADKSIYDMERVFAVNTIGLLNVLKHSFPFLKETKGSFFQVGSIAFELSYEGAADYCASKAASHSIMKTIRKEWLGSGIRTTSLEVGLGETNFQRNRYSGDENKMAQHTSGVRQIQPIDLGQIVHYISEAPDYLNFDEIILKPLDQASHGITVKTI